MRPLVAVIGRSLCSKETSLLAEKVGAHPAARGVVLVCGGLGGVMEAAARGAKRAGGTTVGILPGFSAREANAYIDIPIVTGLSHARNVIVVRSAEAVIALKAWAMQEGVLHAETSQEAVQKALKLLPGFADGK